MIRAGGHDTDGRPMFLLGLTERNLHLLARRRLPIVCDSATVRLDPPLEVWLVGGANRQAIAAELAGVGVPVDADGDPQAALTSCLIANPTAGNPRVGGPARIRLILGIPAGLGAAMLEHGRILSTAVNTGAAGGGPTVVVMAGPNEDAIAARISTAGWLSPGTQFDDLRHPRT